MPCVEPFIDPAAQAMLARASMPRRALFLDRDGVINVDHDYVHRIEDVEWVPGIFELVRDASDAGFLPIVVTNQAGVGRGYYTEERFLAFTRWMHEAFARRGTPLLATYWCPHHADAGIGEYKRQCPCRKPEPGMLLAALAAFDIDPSASLLLGDKPGDVAAARAAGVADAILVVDGRLPAWSGLGIK
jgi:D-glycero-D-manno-heptose 1,7-bisphosphate phosphatase